MLTVLKMIINRCTHTQSLIHVRLFTAPQTVAGQAPLSTEFSKQEYRSGLPFPTPGDLPNPRIKPPSLASLALHVDFFYHCAICEAHQWMKALFII